MNPGYRHKPREKPADGAEALDRLLGDELKRVEKAGDAMTLAAAAWTEFMGDDLKATFQRVRKDGTLVITLPNASQRWMAAQRLRMGNELKIIAAGNGAYTKIKLEAGA